MSRPPLARPSRALALSLFAGTSAWAAADTALAEPLPHSLLAEPGPAAVLARYVLDLPGDPSAAPGERR